MSDLDFSKTSPVPVPEAAARPAALPVYNAAVAMDFFRSGGKSEEVPAGAALFSAGDKTGGLFSKNDKMYLLLGGDVQISAGGRVLGSVKVGEIFGEMAALTELPRSATATAKVASRVISMEGKQFQAAIQQKPEFALMLMSIMILRIRQTAAELRKRNQLGPADLSKASTMLDRKMMEGLKKLLHDREPIRFPAGRVIMKEGDTGALMYLVLEGTIAISIQQKVVERVGPGGIFGEMALVDQSPRSANATAEADCALHGINRNDFLALVKTSPTFGMALLKGIADRLTFMTSHFK